MNTITSTLSQFNPFQKTAEHAVHWTKMNHGPISDTLNVAKSEAKEMSKNFLIGTAFAKLNGARNSYSFGTVFSFSNLAGKYIYPAFYRNLNCTTDTKIRNVIVNLFANLTTTAVANIAAYQLGCAVNADDIIAMKVTAVLIPTLMKALDCPKNKIPELLPELVTSIALSILFGISVNSLGYEINPYTIIKQQAAMIATSIHLRKIVQTGEYYMLNSIDQKDLQGTPQKAQAVSNETPIPASPPLPPKITLTEAQKQLRQKPESEVIKSQIKTTFATYAFFHLFGWVDAYFNADPSESAQCPAPNQTLTCPNNPFNASLLL